MSRGTDIKMAEVLKESIDILDSHSRDLADIGIDATEDYKPEMASGKLVVALRTLYNIDADSEAGDVFSMDVTGGSNMTSDEFLHKYESYIKG